MTGAVDRELIEESPIPGLRSVLRRRSKTKKGRSEAGPKANPIERAEDVAALIAAAEARKDRAGVVTLLALFAGLRLGEATAISWSRR